MSFEARALVHGEQEGKEYLMLRACVMSNISTQHSDGWRFVQVADRVSDLELKSGSVIDEADWGYFEEYDDDEVEAYYFRYGVTIVTLRQGCKF